MKNLFLATISCAILLTTMPANAWWFGPYGYNSWYYGYYPEYYYVPNVIIDNSINAGRDVYINTGRAPVKKSAPRCQERTICEGGNCQPATICPR